MLGCIGPMSRLNGIEPVVASYTHGQLHRADIDVLICEHARYVIQGSQTYMALHSDEERVVFSMRVCAGDQPIEYQRVGKSSDVLKRGRRCVSQEISNCDGTRPTFSFVLTLGRDTKSLATVFRVKPEDLFALSDAVESLDDDSDCAVKLEDFGQSSIESQPPRQHHAEMLVFGMPWKLITGRLENVRCRHAAGRDAPPAPLPKQCSLRLCSRETELAAIVFMSPCGSIPRKL